MHRWILVGWVVPLPLLWFASNLAVSRHLMNPETLAVCAQASAAVYLLGIGVAGVIRLAMAVFRKKPDCSSSPSDVRQL